MRVVHGLLVAWSRMAATRRAAKKATAVTLKRRLHVAHLSWCEKARAARVRRASVGALRGKGEGRAMGDTVEAWKEVATQGRAAMAAAGRLISSSPKLLLHAVLDQWCDAVKEERVGRERDGLVRRALQAEAARSVSEMEGANANHKVQEVKRLSDKMYHATAAAFAQHFGRSTLKLAWALFVHEVRASLRGKHERAAAILHMLGGDKLPVSHHFNVWRSASEAILKHRAIAQTAAVGFTRRSERRHVAETLGEWVHHAHVEKVLRVACCLIFSSLARAVMHVGMLKWRHAAQATIRIRAAVCRYCPPPLSPAGTRSLGWEVTAGASRRARFITSRERESWMMARARLQHSLTTSALAHT